MPLAPVVPPASSVPPPSAAAEENSSADSPFAHENLISTPLLRHRRQERTGTWKMLAVGAGLAAIVVGLTAVSILFVITQHGDRAPDGMKFIGDVYNNQGSTEQAFRVIVPRDTWEYNQTFRTRLKAVVALERKVAVEGSEGPGTVVLVVAAQDYGRQKPRDAELLRRGIERLELCFGDKLELEARPDVREVDWGKAGRSLPAQVLEFGGQRNEVDWKGDMYALTQNGFAYWVYVLGPDLETARKALADLHNVPGMGFRVATRRQGWTERPPPQETFAARKEPIRVRAPAGPWTEFKATEEDPNGVLFLYGRDKVNRKDNLKSATLLIVSLPRRTDDLKEALQVARDYVETAYNRDAKGKGDAEIKPVSDSKKYELVEIANKADRDHPNGVLRLVGKNQARLAELKLKNAEGKAWKYVLLAAVQQPDRMYILRCECFWPNYQIWRGDFLDMLDTVEIGKTE